MQTILAFIPPPKKKLHEVTIFLYSHLPQKLLHGVTMFCTRIYRKKRLHNTTIFFCTRVYRKKKYTQLLHKKLHELHACSQSGPVLILYPALKRWGARRRHGLCSQSAHLWASSDFVPRSEALGTPQTAQVMLPIRLLVGHF